MTDPFNIKNLRLPDDLVPVPQKRAVQPRKLEKRRKHFVQVPWHWVEALSGASGYTWQLALHLLYLHWKYNGKPIKLANGMLEMDGVSRWSKYRALEELERRGLITVGRRSRKSPVVTVLV